MGGVQLEAQVMEEIVQRTADAMVAKGCPFRGVLFAGLMVSAGKVRPQCHPSMDASLLHAHTFFYCSISVFECVTDCSII